MQHPCQRRPLIPPVARRNESGRKRRRKRRKIRYTAFEHVGRTNNEDLSVCWLCAVWPQNEDDVKTGDAPDASLPAPSTQAGGGPSTASPTGSNSTAINQTFQVLKQKPRTFAQKMMNPHGDFKMSFSLDKPLVFKDDAGATKKPATAAAGSLTAKDKAKPLFSFDASSLKFGKK